MKRRTLVIAVFLLAAVIGTTTPAHQQSNAATAPEAKAAAYTLSGPYSHKNLTIFLIHGKDQTPGKPPLTLQEAMKQRKVVVRETGSVNQLTIRNRSQEEVFVQAGDIVKGGQQDRVLALDMILPPNSGRIPIDAFCVENGRWSQRGGEAKSAFNSSNNTLASKGLKLAARNSRSQDEVWENVSVAQNKLAKNYAVAKGVPGGRAMGGGGGNDHGAGSALHVGGGDLASASPGLPAAPPAQVPNAATNQVRVSAGVLNSSNSGATLAEQLGLSSVTSRVSPTSLQLTLENKNVKDSTNDYVKALASILAGKKNVIGYVFAINGQFNSADVYASQALFKKLWPKLLEASAVEAFAEFDQNAKPDTLAADAAKAFLRNAETGKPETKNLRPRTRMVKRESEKNLLFETRDRNRSGAWLHRSYLAK